MAADILHRFYCRKDWRDLSHRLKVERGGKCERTGKVFTDMSQLIAHHKIELTEDNVNDPHIALNPEHIEIISFDEHNKEHRRFGNNQKVYIVYGSPLSGKNTLVRELMQYGDIVLDIDALWQAITLQPDHVKPQNVRFNVFKLRDCMLDQIKTRYGNWYDAYVISSLSDKYERERMAEMLGADLIYCDSTQDDCIERFKSSGRPGAWLGYITDWWEKYTE